MTTSSTRPPLRFAMPLQSRLMLLVFLWIIGMIITGVVSYLFTRNGLSTPKVRVATVAQDLFLFIIPALATAMLSTRRPAELLAVERRPATVSTLLAICAMISSIPLMNAIVAWNASLTLPASMASLEQWMRNAEDNAGAMVDVLIGPHSIGSLIVSVLIIGVFAGFSEEILFRGALQRLLVTGRVNPHVAIWFTAVIFSAVHMQFFGFVPRLLLGAFFGYLLYWTSSLWVPVIIHALNNSIVVISMWRADGATPESVEDGGVIDINSFGTDSTLTILASVVLTSLLIYALIRNSNNSSHQSV